eukprot:10249715-Ditylum_brightwellii.AAC.1
MQSLSGKETLASKCAYKHFAVKHGVTVKKYHSDHIRANKSVFVALELTIKTMARVFCQKKNSPMSKWFTFCLTSTLGGIQFMFWMHIFRIVLVDSFPPGNPESTTWDLWDDVQQAPEHVFHEHVKQFLPLSAVVKEVLPVCKGGRQEPSINHKGELKDTAPLTRELPSVPSQEMVEQQAIFHAEVTSFLWDETINDFSPMAFAANQQQNETYMFKGMLKQEDAKSFVIAMLDDI